MHPAGKLALHLRRPGPHPPRLPLTTILKPCVHAPTTPTLHRIIAAHRAIFGHVLGNAPVQAWLLQILEAAATTDRAVGVQSAELEHRSAAPAADGVVLIEEAEVLQTSHRARLAAAHGAAELAAPGQGDVASLGGRHEDDVRGRGRRDCDGACVVVHLAGLDRLPRVDVVARNQTEGRHLATRFAASQRQRVIVRDHFTVNRQLFRLLLGPASTESDRMTLAISKASPSLKLEADLSQRHEGVT